MKASDWDIDVEQLTATHSSGFVMSFVRDPRAELIGRIVHRPADMESMDMFWLMLDAREVLADALIQAGLRLH